MCTWMHPLPQQPVELGYGCMIASMRVRSPPWNDAWRLGGCDERVEHVRYLPHRAPGAEMLKKLM